jgi:MIP family channel proteins
LQYAAVFSTFFKKFLDCKTKQTDLLSHLTNLVLQLASYAKLKKQIAAYCRGEMNNDMIKKCLAEIIGTFFLVFFGCGALIASAEPVSVALAFGFALLIGIYALGPISGAHLNPAATLGLFLSKKFPFSQILPYWIAQIAGATLAAGALGLLAREPAHKALYGSTIPSLNPFASIGFEILLTFTLVFVIIAVTTNPKVSPTVGGLTIGFTVAAAGLAFSTFGVGSLNPARSLGPALFAGSEALKHVWIYIVGPFIGAILASCLYEAIRSHD